ncbi:hypothetical protein ACKFKF_34325 [Phormidesmis sp. 146-12]
MQAYSSAVNLKLIVRPLRLVHLIRDREDLLEGLEKVPIEVISNLAKLTNN